MKKYEISTIGTFHTNHNEDAVMSADLGKGKFLLAVMDGCSMGKESHFASTLMVKILRKTAKEMAYKNFIEKKEHTLAESLKEILKSLFEQMNSIQQQLMLETEELLSTLMLLVLDEDNREAEVLVVGDGLVCCNRTFTEFEQEDKPDYLGYHLSENFDEWLAKQKQRLSLTQIEDLSISTDGIFTFKKFDQQKYRPIKEKDWASYLLINQHWENHLNPLKRSLLEMEQDFGLKPSDDLTVLRIILEKKM